MKTPEEGKTDPERGTRFDRIVKQVGVCDSSVRGVVVLDALGHIITGWSSPSAVTTDQISAERAAKMGVVAKIVIGAVEKETSGWGKLQFLVAAFQNDKLVLVDLQEQNITLVVGIARSTMADYVYEKVAKILAETK